MVHTLNTKLYNQWISEISFRKISNYIKEFLISESIDLSTTW